MIDALVDFMSKCESNCGNMKELCIIKIAGFAFFFIIIPIVLVEFFSLKWLGFITTDTSYIFFSNSTKTWSEISQQCSNPVGKRINLTRVIKQDKKSYALFKTSDLPQNFSTQIFVNLSASDPYTVNDLPYEVANLKQRSDVSFKEIFLDQSFIVQFMRTAFGISQKLFVQIVYCR